MNPVFNKLFLSVLVITLTSCMTTQKPQTPQQVAQGYWDAKIAQNKAQILKYSSVTDTQLPSDPQISLGKNATVTFGNMQRLDNDAKVDTTVQFSEGNESVSLTFATVLIKEMSGWKVNNSKTMNNIQAKRKEVDSKQNGTAALVKKLRELGDEFAKDIDKAKAELKKQIPEIKKEMESLGKNVEKEFSDALKQVEPTIKKNLQEFTDEINKAIEEAKKKHKNKTQPEVDPSIKSI